MVRLYKMEVHCARQCHGLPCCLANLLHILLHVILRVSPSERRGLSSRVIFSAAVLLHTGTARRERLNGSLFQMSDPVPGFNTQIKSKQTGRTIKCHNPPEQTRSTALTSLMVR